MASPRRLGLVVNPIAGMGGRVALKGTDGADALRLARERGAVPIAADRARRALAALREQAPPLRVLAAPGEMGADLAVAAGLDTEATGPPFGRPTGAPDTRAAAEAMLRAGVDLLLFAGGDGTARDIHDAVDSLLPVVGVPTGVKMHSGVFAATPQAAGAAAGAYLRSPGPLREGEIADVDEDAARAGRLATRLYGSALVPQQPSLVVGAKAASARAADADLAAACRQVARTMEPGRLYLVGPGTTTGRVLEELGIVGTLLGVDAVRDGRLVGADLDEAAILALLDHAPDATLICGVVGGQGSLFGRGNQQLSPHVLRRLGRDRIQVIAAADKLLALRPLTLRVDTSDDELDRALSGYLRVRVGADREIVMRVST